MTGAGHPPIRRDGNRTLKRRESESRPATFAYPNQQPFNSHIDPSDSFSSDIRLPTSYPALGWPLRYRLPTAPASIPTASTPTARPRFREQYAGGTVGIAHRAGVEGHSNARLPRDALLDRHRLRARIARDAMQTLRLPRSTCPTAYTGCLRI